MILRRYLSLFIVLCAAVLVVLPASAGAETHPTTSLAFCGGSVTTRCIVSVTRNGVPVTEVDPTYGVEADRDFFNRTNTYHFSVALKGGGGFNLPHDDVWDVKLNMGGVYPDETFERGRDISIVRGGNLAGGYTVDIKMKPERMATTPDGCGSTGVCPSVATNPTYTGYLEGVIDDIGYATDPDFKASLHNFDLASNTDWISSPLQLDYDTNTIKLDVANSHFEHDGTTVFHGHAEFSLPNSMLSSLYNVDDPSSLTAAAFSVAAGGGATPTTTVTVGSDAVQVVIDGLTFSKRALRIAGRTQPRQPRKLTASRTRPTRAVIRSAGSLRRGSKVRGYTITCVSGSQRLTVQSKSHGAFKVRIGGLHAGHRYRCVVRARSHAGPGNTGHVVIPKKVRS